MARSISGSLECVVASAGASAFFIHAGRSLFEYLCGLHFNSAPMYIIAIAWIYVVFMMAITETTVIAGIMTFLLYGLLPVSIIVYVMGAGGRKRKRRAQEIERQERLKQQTLEQENITQESLQIGTEDVQLTERKSEV